MYTTDRVFTSVVNEVLSYLNVTSMLAVRSDPVLNVGDFLPALTKLVNITNYAFDERSTRIVTSFKRYCKSFIQYTSQKPYSLEAVAFSKYSRKVVFYTKKVMLGYYTALVYSDELHQAEALKSIYIGVFNLIKVYAEALHFKTFVGYRDLAKVIAKQF